MSATVIETAKRRARKATSELPPKSELPSPLARVAGIAVLVVATIYFIAPVLWVMIASTKSNRDLTSSFGFWFAEWNLPANYDSLMTWTQGLFWQWVGNSIFYSVSAGVIGTLFAVMAGYAVAKFVFPGKTIAVGSNCFQLMP